jgi:hypothetical protein
VGSHDPFGHFKHKLWPKDWVKVKLAIWLLTTKSREYRLNFLACRWHAIYHWKACDEGYNFALDLISIRSLNINLWAHKVARVQTLGISRLPLGSPGQNAIWVLVPCLGTEYTIRGKVVASPKSGPWWVLWVRVCPSLVLAPKVFQLCIKQLVVWCYANLCY